MIVLLALVCISNRFSFLVAFCLPLQSFIFLFSSSLHIFIFLLPPLCLFHFFQLYLLFTYTMFENVTSCVCTTSELIPGKRVQMCVHLGMQIMNGSLRFTDRGKGWRWYPKAANCHMALTLGAAIVAPASRRFIDNLPCKTWNYLYSLIVLVRQYIVRRHIEKKKFCVSRFQ